MSILRYKQRLFADGGVYRDSGPSGGGSSGGATQSTVYNTNIPEYAQPYVSNMLNAAQAQIYNPDMTGFNPYQAYSGMNEQDLQNAQQAVADFSPLQKQAQSAAANLQTPGQYGAATGAAGLGTGQALTAADRYSGMATSPYAMGAYMNPYLNSALQPQLQEIGRQYDITGTQEMSNATKSGAFGGNREALMAAENQRNKNIAMNQAIGTGYNNAFNQAQQAQQFGANLGLQGAQAGIQGAGQLAGIGGQQLAAQQSILGTQAQQGALQQQNQQNVINQGLQNYATAQQYPYLQLGTLNSMLRGLPMQQSSTQMYQAPPSQVSQLAGLGTAGLGAAAMYNSATKAEGGAIKGYAPGGAIPMKSYSDTQLQQAQKSNYTDPIGKLYAQGLQIDRGELRNNPEAAKLIAQSATPQPQAGMPPPQQVAEMPQQRTGLGSISTGDMVPETFKAGGIMAFADEGEVPPPKAENDVDKALSMYADKSGKVDLNKAALALMGQAKSGKDSIAPEREEIMKNLEAQKNMTGARTLTRFGLDLMRQPSQYALVNAGTAGINTLNTYEKEQAAENELRRSLAKLDAEGAAKDDARRLHLAGTLLQIQGQRDMKMAALANAPSGEDRAINRAQTLVNNDPTIKALTKQQSSSGAQPGTPEYDYYEQRIAERQMQIFKTAGVNVPEVTPTKIQYPKQEEKPGFFSGLFSGGKSEPAQPKVVPFNQLPT